MTQIEQIFTDNNSNTNFPHHPLYIINLIPRRHGGLEIFGRFVFIGIKQIYLNLCQSRQISVILWSIFSSSSLTPHPLTPRPS